MQRQRGGPRTLVGIVIAFGGAGLGCGGLSAMSENGPRLGLPSPLEARWGFDEGRGFEVRESVTGRLDRVEFVFDGARFKPTTDLYWQTGCVVDDCLLFDGYSNVINTPELPESVLRAGITLSAWVAPHAFEWGDGGRFSAVLSEYDPTTQRGLVFGIYRHGAWGVRLGLGGESTLIRTDASPLVRDAWSHIAASYHPGQRRVRLYLDGREVASVAVPGTRGLELPERRPLRIGKHSEPHGVAGIFDFNTFHGLMDDVRVEERVVPAEEIAERVRAALAPHGGEKPQVRPEMVWIPRSTFDGDRYRPQYHLLPHAHWMNEPHAPFYFRGKYHLFYQKNPFGPFWHQIHWGHWVSEDLVRWRELPIALYPDPDAVAPDGIWSGSASYDAQGEPVLFFTAGNDSVFPKERTGLAVPADIDDPDLIRWTKYPQPVTLQEKGQGEYGQFRDPFVWKHPEKDVWYQLVTSGIPGGSGTALAFSSTNLTEWKYHGPFFATDIDRYPFVGKIWELPVLLPIGRGSDGETRYIFTFNAAGALAVREAYYWVGRFDEEQVRFVPDHEDPRLFDVGRDHFTGPSGMVDPKTGRAILFSIAQGERTPHAEYDSGWAHNAGLPLHVWLGPDDQLRVGPLEEMSTLRTRPLLEVSDLAVAEANEALSVVSGDLLDIQLEVEAASLGSGPVGLTVRRTPDEIEKIDLTYDRGQARFEIDRRKMSLDPDVRGKRIDGGEADIGREDLRLRVFLDRSMIEAYLNDRKSLTSRAFPARRDATGLRIIGPPDGRVLRLTVHEMGSAFEGGAAPIAEPGANVTPAEAWTSDLPNHDFASCDTEGWETEGDAFSGPTVTDTDRFNRNIYFNPSFTIPGGCHLWGFRAWSGDAAVGTMRSRSFVLGGDGGLNFLVAGGDDLDRLYVALVRDSDGAILFKATGVDYEEYRRVFWDASSFLGEIVHLELVDRTREPWGHLNFDDVHVRVDRFADAP